MALAVIEAFRFGRSLAGTSKRSIVAAVQSLFRSSNYCNVSLLILGEGRSYVISELLLQAIVRGEDWSSQPEKLVS